MLFGNGEKTLKRMKTLKIVASIIGSVVGICIGVWYFGEAPLQNYVDGRIKAYMVSPEFKMFVDITVERAKNEAVEQKKQNDSGKVKLRTLFSDKMGVPEDEVHIEMGKLYRNEEAHKKELKDFMDKVSIHMNEIRQTSL